MLFQLKKRAAANIEYPTSLGNCFWFVCMFFCAFWDSFLFFHLLQKEVLSLGEDDILSGLLKEAEVECFGTIFHILCSIEKLILCSIINHKFH